MTYGLDRRLPSETAPAGAPRARANMRLSAWRQLDEQSRLRLIERELRPANDLIDGFPPAV